MLPCCPVEEQVVNICNNRSAERTVKRKMRLPALPISPRRPNLTFAAPYAMRKQEKENS